MRRLIHNNRKKMPMKTKARISFVPRTPRHTPVWWMDWNQR
jgi:hypothetical protein